MLDYFESNFSDTELLFINIIILTGMLDYCLIWFCEIIREIIYEKRRKKLLG